MVMLCSDVARCALTTLLAVFAADHVATLAALAPVAAVLGGCSALFLPASMAMMPSLVAADGLASANAVYTGTLQVSSLLGPAIGGVVVAAAGPTAAFGVDAASYLLSAASLALMAVGRLRRGTAGEAAQTAPTATLPSSAAIEGVPTDAVRVDHEPAAAAERENVWRLLLRARILRIILVVSVTANFAVTGTTEVALPALAHARFGADGYGAILACVALASLAGTIIAVRTRTMTRPAVVIGIVFLFAAIAIGLAPFLGGLPGAAGGMAVFGLALGFDNVLVTMLQQWAPPGMLGRVMGLLVLASAGSFPLSAAIAGLLTRHLGPSPVFPIAGALLAAAILAGLTQREFRDFGTTQQIKDP
jgi:predicted MFS family arabinose efflux permease